MKLRLIFVLTLYMVVTQAFAQRDDVWYFGEGAGLDFSGCAPAALADSGMLAAEGCTVISGPSGLLFYSNGQQVWNRNHQLMNNSQGLNGDISSTQTLIIPRPGYPDRYYLFYISIVTNDIGLPIPGGLYYSEIDMTGDGGLGSVIVKNVLLLSPVCEKLSATWHANETDVWLTTHEWGTDAFYSYLISSAGISATPVISNAGSIVTGDPLTFHFAGYMKTSPDGSKLVAAHTYLNVQLFDFDNTSGVVSNPVTLNTGGRGYGLEFSPTSNLLYVNIGTRIFQYQLNSFDIPGSEVPLPTILAADHPLQLGPDGRIYVVSSVVYRTLSVINNPNGVGDACNLQLNAVDLMNKRPLFGLPTFIPSPFYLNGINVSGSCAGTQVSLTADVTMQPEHIEWDFGDGTTGTGLTVSHNYSTPGTYTVVANAYRKGYKRCAVKTVVIQDISATAPQNFIQCDTSGNDGIDTFDLSSFNDEVLGGQPTTNLTVSYHLTQSEAVSGENPLPAQYTNLVTPQVIYARVANNQNNCYATTSFQLVVLQKPVLNMEDVYAFCDGNSIPVAAPSGFDGYLWSNGATTREIQATPGEYTVTVFKDYGGVQCEVSATITVKKSGPPTIVQVIKSDWSDSDNTIEVVAEGEGTFEYALNSGPFQPEPVFNNLEPGIYTIHVKDKSGCGQAEEEVVLLTYARFFTPNGDNVNDTWRIRFGQYEQGLMVHIYDRYGKYITSFKGSSAGWDGKLNGKDLPSTDYWFVALRPDGKQYKGHFSLIR